MSLGFDAWLYIVQNLLRSSCGQIMTNMRIPIITNHSDKVQLTRLSHIYFEHADLEKFRKFADDFGFVEAKSTRDRVYYRGYGRDQYVYVALKSIDDQPRFKGPAFVAKSQGEFEKAKKLPGAIVSDMSDGPGGGEKITFNRPDDTFFHIIWGQEEQAVDLKEPTATHERVGPFNRPFEKSRRGEFQRFHPGPALVHKLGHLGYAVLDFDNELKWYTENFSFVPSDILYHWNFSNMDVLTFMHLDLGDDYSDHHCVFLQRAAPHVKKTFLHHTSFEVADFDTQLLGHDWLAKKGWHSVWGVGRHADPSGFKIEHYADGDIVNKDTPTRREVVGPLLVWGPEIPKEFGQKITVAGMGTMADV
ncbi:Glyoxalase/Bleomycin resistance protein/Dihydroxybiphenyl dioxygenase [Boeremia exigua]|uniref:Glyoxalase/Bleomycin resistance protein/Dihydroxybiphenyl dioxygenase n=1 Tax=Boeremia exigua TaxID=749465 RepID=UPI001E8DCED0|nr:Glyoxalase/Bleomycin resistance protein/Dihydroxybiphenyl dioxygenase [Boeremia exigua]KAH6615403.1 Glyoxalase/Bleomycin resistance protein/Dihydroxybiphenyl dioxygenase [Boeremia exigua]